MQYLMDGDIGVIKGDGEFVLVLKGKFFGPFPFTEEYKEKLMSALSKASTKPARPYPI